MSEINKTLKAIGEDLPAGSINRIAEKTGFSQSYVSKFFNGQYSITDKNICVIDEAEVILTEELEKSKPIQSRLNDILTKANNRP